MLVSVIIPTLNRENYLKLAIDSVARQSFPFRQYEILVVDNGSIDNTNMVCKSAHEIYSKHNIKYIYEPIPGLLSGRHRGALEAKGDILVFVDDDIEADTNWLSAIYEAFKMPEVHLVGGRNLPKYETERPAWLNYLWSSTPYGGKKCGYLSLIDMGSEMKEIDPNYVWGLNFSVRRKTLFELGGFHPDCMPKNLQRFQGDGETGLTLKMKENGYKAVYQPCALVYHSIPPKRMTLSYFEDRMFYQGVCDSYTMIRKNRDVLIGSIFSQETNKKVKFHKVMISGIAKFFHLESKLRKEYEYIKKKMQDAYNDGFKFHQTEVANDPELLKWILKDNYWDYCIPATNEKKI